MADVADVSAEPKRCRAAGLGVEQWRSVEVRVAPWSRPYRRQRHQMGQVQGMNQWLPDIRINMAGQPLVHTLNLAHLMRSEEHTSELQSLMRISYAVFCLKTKKNQI